MFIRINITSSWNPRRVSGSYLNLPCIPLPNITSSIRSEPHQRNIQLNMPMTMPKPMQRSGRHSTRTIQLEAELINFSPLGPRWKSCNVDQQWWAHMPCHAITAATIVISHLGVFAYFVFYFFFFFLFLLFVLILKSAIHCSNNMQHTINIHLIYNMYMQYITCMHVIAIAWAKRMRSCSPGLASKQHVMSCHAYLPKGRRVCDRWVVSLLYCCCIVELNMSCHVMSLHCICIYVTSW